MNDRPSLRASLVLLAIAGAVLPAAIGARPAKEATGWTSFESDAAASHYSPFTDIDRTNVGDLTQAWAYEVGDIALSCEPLVLSDRLILVGEGGAIVALDPGTGRQLWRTEDNVAYRGVRGLAYWRSPDGKEERIFLPSATSVRALDPETGKIYPDFRIDLRQGLDRDPQKIRRIAPTSPGRVFENLLILGSITGENYDSPPGDVRAFDVRTGKLVWTFHTVPRPGERGAESWPADAWSYSGGANAWGGHTVDESRGILYFVTGSAVYDFYGGDRKGDNLYANSLVALDARTGKYLWHFQAVHHDLWDYDMVASPTLLTVRRGGKRVDAVAAAGKTGFLYVFDRVTGKPLFPIVERPVPQSDVPGEYSSPTQPFSTLPPFARQSFTEADLDPEMPEAERKAFAERMRKARNEGIFTPPALDRETVQMPGNHGGANWGQTGAGPLGRYYVVSINLPAMLQLKAPVDKAELERIAAASGKGAAIYAESCAMCHGEDRKGQSGIPGLAGIAARMPEADMRSVIRMGRATMPSFAHLASADLDALSTYLRTEGRLAAAASPPPGASSPLRMPGTETADRSPNGSMRYRTGYNQVDFTVRPPWQTLTSYDLNSGKILWQVPVGTVPGRAAPTGRAFIKGGLLITAGGLVFVATEADRKLHAYDSDTGKPLWSGALPSHPRGGLISYRYRGRQFILVTAGFGGAFGMFELPGSAPGRNAYLAFALPTGQ